MEITSAYSENIDLSSRLLMPDYSFTDKSILTKKRILDFIYRQLENIKAEKTSSSELHFNSNIRYGHLLMANAPMFGLLGLAELGHELLIYAEAKDQRRTVDCLENIERLLKYFTKQIS